MLTLTNISLAQMDLARFDTQESVTDFLRLGRLDGFELFLYEGGALGPLPKSSVKGVHLPYFASFLPFWRNEKDTLRRRFGTLEAACRHYHARTKEELIAYYQKNLDFACDLGSEYVVFHIQEASPWETVSYRFCYDDGTVLACALELINALRVKRPGTAFLVENLWWPGFRMTDPTVTKRLMDSIIHPNKGIMLDLGHLLHTNTALRTPQDAVRYIEHILSAHHGLLHHIRGVHLHQTLSGRFVEAMRRSPPRLTGTYQDAMMQSFGAVMRIDSHRPCLFPGIYAILNTIKPTYLVYELITRSHQEHIAFIAQQNAWLERDKHHVQPKP